MSKRTWKKQDFINAVQSSLTISETLRKLNLSISYGNYNTFRKYKEKWNVDTTHFNVKKVQSEKSKKANKKRWPLEDVMIKNSWYSRSHLRARLIKNKIIPYECSMCKITTWQNKKLSLHLDHINGDNIDHRLENLRFLCPNCHSQTSSYGGKRHKIKENFICKLCGGKKVKSSELCRQCYKDTHDTKIDWPNTTTLIKMVKESSYKAVGRKLGVSDNSVRSRIQNYPI